MAVLAYTTAFCALVWMNTGTFRLIKIYSEVPEDSAFISNKSRFDRCWHCWDSGVTVRQTDRWTDGFLALYSRRLASVPTLSCRCMAYKPINCYVSYVFFSYSCLSISLSLICSKFYRLFFPALPKNYPLCLFYSHIITYYPYIILLY